MARRNLDYVVIAAMLVCGLYVTASGLVADAFGFHQVFLHSTLGYACAALGAIHLALNWPRVKVYLGHLLKRDRRQGQTEQEPDEEDGGPATGRRQVLVAGLAAAGGFVLGRLIPGRGVEDLPGDAEDVGQLYHQWSKPGASQLLGAVLDWGERPEPYKTYPDAERVTLPDPASYGEMNLEGAIEARRSIREYAGDSLSLHALSALLQAAQGITAPGREYRAAPSAGALYPIELYPVVHDVDGLEAGLYHYAVQEHALELLEPADLRAAVTRAGLGQDFLGRSNVCFVLSALFQRTRWRYRERTYRYVMLEAGHIGQNLYLAATAMGLGACAVGAFLDGELNQLLRIDGREEAAIYLVSVGTV